LNQGFEILFGIIQTESDVDEASVVIQDCLSICRNILYDCDPCQRLFFAMGQEWTLRLSEYFTPYFLEKPTASGPSDGDDDMFWADKLDYARCAFLAMDALVGALSVPNPKHQQLVALEVADVIPSAMFWIARGGPSYLIHAGLTLISRCVEGNNKVGAEIMNMSIQLSPSIVGKNVPHKRDNEAPSQIHELLFGWKPLPNDDRKCIAVVSLLAERYVYASRAWNGKITFADVSGNNSQLAAVPSAFTHSVEEMDVSTADGFSQSCYFILDALLAADSSMTGMLIQYVVAPPPPLPDDDHGGSLESMKPLCSILFGLVLDVCFKLSDASHVHSSNFRTDSDVAERAANILTLVLLHGGHLARELSTALNTVHLSSSSTTGGRQQVRCVPSFMFTTIIKMHSCLCSLISRCCPSFWVVLGGPQGLPVLKDLLLPC
jgi:hypothetical protein